MLLSKLKRTTKSTKFIPELDGLRFIAIFSVILFHTNSSLSKVWGYEDYGTMALGGAENMLKLGWWFIRLDFGVKLFFVISGFILSVPFIKHLVQGKRIDLAAYYKRRLIRLEPPYVISLLFFALVHFFLLNTGINNISLHLFSGLLYLHGLIYGYANPINPISWSLEVEAQFYIFLPLFYLLFMKVKNSLFIVFFTIALFVVGVYLKNYISSERISHFYASILYFAPNFLTGVFLGALFVKDKTFFKTKSMVWDVITIVSFLGIFFYYKPQSSINNIFAFNFSLLFFFLSAFKGNLMNYLMTRPLIYIIGGMCYSIYLLHYAFLHLLALAFTPVIKQFTENYISGVTLYAVIAIPLSILISAVYFLIVEKPFMDPKIQEHVKKLSLSLKGNTK